MPVLRSTIKNSLWVLFLASIFAVLLSSMEIIFSPYASFTVLFKYMFLCSIIPSMIIQFALKKIRDL